MAPTIGPRPPARDHHGAATLQGQLYIYGGRCSERREKDSVLADVWSFLEPCRHGPLWPFKRALRSKSTRHG